MVTVVLLRCNKGSLLPRMSEKALRGEMLSHKHSAQNCSRVLLGTLPCRNQIPEKSLKLQDLNELHKHKGQKAQ